MRRGGPEEEELELLALLIERYEKDMFSIPEAEPVDVIRFVMDQNNLSVTDLGVILNSNSRASEILAKKRPLSLNHIRLIHAALNIPTQLLIKEYPLAVS